MRSPSITRGSAHSRRGQQWEAKEREAKEREAETGGRNGRQRSGRKPSFAAIHGGRFWGGRDGTPHIHNAHQEVRVVHVELYRVEEVLHALKLRGRAVDQVLVAATDGHLPTRGVGLDVRSQCAHASDAHRSTPYDSPFGHCRFPWRTLDVCAHSSKGRRRLSRYTRTPPSAHLARDGDLIVMLVPVRRQVTVRVVKHKSHTRTADASLTLLIDELVQVARSHLTERRVGRVRR